ncbi:KAP family P-loop NTPase fold protein [Nitratifractor salsuginis]|uniref:KAP family P-loop NTPase fold protein n=1 Tax=Nitratifractor salsuginis TaxID=269261 RepID=UPI001CB6D4CD|nr:P-loop NTPase fold protein [Nitratifractor salsuginis]
MDGTERDVQCVTGDNPIHRRKDDVLGRADMAHSFAEHVLSLDVTEGAVVGVLGPWGSGKTSFVNLARECLECNSVAVLDFNPWMYSGADQLVESFFVELSAQLRLRPELFEVGKELEDYGEIFSGMSWLPLVGPWIERGRAATKIFAKILQRRKKEGIYGRRAKVVKALGALDKPLTVVLDDIDRLTTPEIRDIFKLVRLTANFPNVIYILVFDRIRVEEALAEHRIPGRDYLEKILQVGFDLPAVPAHVLNKQILTAIDNALSTVVNTGPFDQNAWADIFMEIIRPLLQNMRDVRRYAAAIRGTVQELGGSVALADVLALEAIRVFLPDVFRELHGAVEGLTTPSGLYYRGDEDAPHLKEQVKRLMQAAESRADVVQALIQRLFPAGERHIGGSNYGEDWKNGWLRERRVAHEEVLRVYLERVIGEGLQALTDAEQAFPRMANREAFDSYLRSLDAERLQDVISSLEVYEEQFAPEHVVPGSVVLLNLLPELPERDQGMFNLDSRMVVGRVVYRLVRTLKEDNAIEEAIRQILPKLTTLSAKEQLITMVGYRDGAGHKLVSEVVVRELEDSWRAEVRATTADRLAKEKELLRILLLTKREAGPAEPALDIPDSPSVTLALLRSARSDVRSLALGSRAVRQSPRLAWDALIELYGSEDILRERINKLKATQSEDVNGVLELADKYLGGWRSSEFGDA